MIADFFNASDRFVSCDVVRSLEDDKEWWSLSQNLTRNPYILGNSSGHDNFLELIVYSARIAPPIFGAIAGIG